ncbi:MAG: AAA family ATPase [Hydrogenophaga sp.]|uniref:AAA family ATPase n=1 Tax=Hydrogenophaga sp. TaxID=1904254 RepID=UPI002606233C|nr:AAA family ATPase [Hydrogenophaga sp.]MDM7942570.1 AAA family ATPase [Hydrogenophaga sp.]
MTRELHQRFERLAAAEHKPSPDETRHPFFDVVELDEKIAALQNLPGDNQQALLRAYGKLHLKGPLRKVDRAPHPGVLEDLVLDFPNFAEVTRWVQDQLHLCRLSAQQSIKLPPILLDGPPGVGKTAYCQQLARRLGVRFESVDLSAARSSLSLLGLDSGYSSSHPGRIWQSLQHDSLSVTWALDEIDKITTEGSDSGSQYLLGLLEPVSAAKFTDNWSALPIDASWIFYVATSNRKALIDGPLLSRFTVFDIPLPHASDLRRIVRSIYQSFLRDEPWGSSFQPELDAKVVDALEGFSPRDIRRLLRAGFARAASQERDRVDVRDIPDSVQKHPKSTRIGFV